MKPILYDKVFCPNCYRLDRNNYCFFSLKSLKYLKDLLIKNNSNNKYILPDDVDVEIFKDIALSNNELVIIDKGNIKNVHTILANRIIKEDDLYKESF